MPFVGTPAMYLLEGNECKETLVGDEAEKDIDDFMQEAYKFVGIEDRYEEKSQ